MDADYLPDLSDWRYVEVWTLEETALLWAAIDPMDYIGMRLNELASHIPKERYKKAQIALRAITEAVCCGTLPFSEAWEEGDGFDAIKTEFPNNPDINTVIPHMTRIRQSAFLKWAAEKKFPSYKQHVINSRRLVQSQTIEGDIREAPENASNATPPLLLPSTDFLDPSNPLSPEELRICAEVWNIVVSEGLHEGSKTPKTAILSVLDSRPQFAKVSRDAKNRVSVVVNWKKGGPQKTPGNK